MRWIGNFKKNDCSEQYSELLNICQDIFGIPAHKVDNFFYVNKFNC